MHCKCPLSGKADLTSAAQNVRRHSPDTHFLIMSPVQFASDACWYIAVGGASLAMLNSKDIAAAKGGGHGGKRI
jgi:hypothetical protein